ncbi:MAG TPA: hypothetical protein VHG71_01765 [Verrucomicrobiae bacterium]|nr:hypothetical protein [Verrucomicrobiae bacterium]
MCHITRETVNHCEFGTGLADIKSDQAQHHHYPTDIYTGRVLAQAIVCELKANPDFQHDFIEVKAKITVAQQLGKN